MPGPVLRFGDFTLSCSRFQLLRKGRELRVERKPMELLILLASREGELVTRDEIAERLWASEVFVDTDHGINSAIRKLRHLLRDDAGHPIFIQTVPGMGYRFVASIQHLGNGGTEANDGAPNIGFIEPRHSVEADVAVTDGREPPVEVGADRIRWPRYILFLSIIFVFFAIGVIAHRFSRRPARPEEMVVLEATPLVVFTGAQSFPAFSPDGSRIAFGWNGETEGIRNGFDLYVKAVGSEAVLRLTHHPSALISAAWSPDGTQIAIHRVDGPDTGIYIVPALGGPERKVQTTRLNAEISRALPISWSPDGRWIAFAQATKTDIETRIFLLSTATWQSQRIASSAECQQEDSPTFSHDGSSLAFACYLGNNQSGLFLKRLNSNETNKVLSLQGFIYGMGWSLGDRSILYSVADTSGPSLREVSLSSRSVTRLMNEGTAAFPTVSAAGHLAFITSTRFYEIWRMQLQRKSPAIKLVPSTAWQQDVDISPDGKYITFQSGRSGVAGIWVSEMNGANLAQLSSPRIRSGSPRWSPDGKMVAYDAMPGGTWEIYIAGLSDRIPKKLETGLSSGIKPHWSEDGKWIYFRSYDAGKEGIYRCSSSGGNAVRLTQDGDTFSPIESLDSKTIYFASHQWNSILKRMNLPLDNAVSILQGVPPIRDANSWALGPGGIYFIPADHPDTLFRFETTTGKVKQVLKLANDFGHGLSVSVDGEWILFSQSGDLSSNIMYVDHLK